MTYTVKDYPLAENRTDEIKGARGKSLPEITLDAVLSGNVTIEDLRITPEALRAQAAIARDVNRPTLAQNFERAAELVNVPQDVIMRVYELLRPGRARSKDELLAAAMTMRSEFKADAIVAFIEEAAVTYEQRGLFSRRF